MSEPDGALIDQAILDRLWGDATMRSLCPDGVWFDTSDEKAKRFIVVSLIDHNDVPVFDGKGWENSLYLVKAVMLNSAGGSPKEAAARIDALLNDWNSAVTDFGHLSTARERRLRYTEKDSENTAIRWLHRGGHYRAHASVA